MYHLGACLFNMAPDPVDKAHTALISMSEGIPLYPHYLKGGRFEELISLYWTLMRE